MSMKSYNHEGYMSPAQKQKVGEIREMEARNQNPLHATIATYLGEHGFNKNDLRNYFYLNPRAFKVEKEVEVDGRQNETNLESA